MTNVSANQSVKGYASIYESTSLATTVAGQHMVEWFTGNSLNTDRWNLHDVAGSHDTATGMVDSANGGFQIKNDNNSDHTQIDFNDIRQYGTECVLIAIRKMASGSQYDTQVGFIDGITATEDDFIQTSLDYAQASSKQTLITKNGGSVNTVVTSLSIDESWHLNKLELTQTSGTLTVDGALESTTTSELPNASMQPYFCGIVPAAGYSANRQCAIRYMECYNT